MQELVGREGMRAEEKGGRAGEADIGMKELRRVSGGRDCNRRKQRQMI